MGSFRTFLGVILSVALLSACSAKKDLDKMMDTTEEMGKTTKDMNNTTKEMNETTKEMGDRMEDAFHGLREGIGEEKMELHYEKLLEADTTGTKIEHALIFFAAMDFQHWQGDHEDDDKKRDQLIYKNVEYFFSKINDIVDDDQSVKTPLLSSKKRNHWKALGALAVAMSKIHPDQQSLSEKLNFTPLSFYDILASGLKQKEQYEKGEDVPSWVEKVLEKEDVAIYLMQLRHNFLKGVILGEMSDFEEGWFDGMINKVGYAWMGSKVNLSEFNNAQMKKWVELLWKSRKTQELLEGLGEELQFNSVLVNSFAKVQFIDYINYPPAGLETVPHPLFKNGPPSIVQHVLTSETFANATSIDPLNMDLQGQDLLTNFISRFEDLKSYGVEE